MFASWTWGLMLIALTIAIHACGVVMMAFLMVRFRAWLEKQNLGLCYVIPIVIGVIGAVGLLLAALHGIETTIWAAAYLWLGAIGTFIDGMLYSVELDDHSRRLGVNAASALADAGRAGVS